MNQLQFACRQRLKHPGFALVAILTLALGIGASTALFSVVHGVLISPYPYARPGEIWTPGVSSAAREQRMRPYRLEEFLEMCSLPVFSDVIATAGIYRVLSYLVSRRTREIGVRMALGARRLDVLGLVLLAGGKLVGLGLLIGVLGSLGVAQVLNHQLELFRVTAVDPVAYLAVALLLGTVATVACLVLARRAANVAPMEALRRE